MKASDCSIISSKWVEEKYQMLKKLNIEFNTPVTNSAFTIIEEVRKQLKPLTPEIDNAWHSGDRYGSESMAETLGTEMDFTALDFEEFLNKEI